MDENEKAKDVEQQQEETAQDPSPQGMSRREALKRMAKILGVGAAGIAVAASCDLFYSDYYDYYDYYSNYYYNYSYYYNYTYYSDYYDYYYNTYYY